MGKKDDKNRETVNITSMRDVKLSEEDKRKLFIMGTGILVALALSIVIFNSLFVHSSTAYYPGNCGNQTSYQQTTSCIDALANTTLNSTVCYYIQGEQQSNCIFNIAQKTQNVSICGQISPSDKYYSKCILDLNKKYQSTSLCEYLPRSTALPCIYNVSAHYNFSSASICSQLNNKSYSSECTYLYYYKNAISTQNKALCAYLPNKNNATDLYFINYNASRNSTFAIENYISLSYLNISVQNYCYYSLAVNENNAAICNSISGSFAAECSYYVQEINASKISFNLNTTNITASCGSYSGYTRNLCNYDYSVKQALANKNTTACSMINISSEKDECILQVAINTTKNSYCAQISNSTIKYVCGFATNSTIK
ncbi:MAG: hypothetical protein ACHQX1_00665 [Candidatus Micrarchaeales archaeon]